MKTIRLNNLSGAGVPINVNIERITAWGPALADDLGAGRLLLDGYWYTVSESEEQIISAIAQARALDFA